MVGGRRALIRCAHVSKDMKIMMGHCIAKCSNDKAVISDHSGGGVEHDIVNSAHLKQCAVHCANLAVRGNN
jgi:hypothetical protein